MVCWFNCGKAHVMLAFFVASVCLSLLRVHMVLRWHFGTKDLSGNFLSRIVGANLWGLWVRGEPRKTAGSILRGAARSRTLKEGPNVC